MESYKSKFTESEGPDEANAAQVVFEKAKPEVKIIYNALFSASFENWYKTDFDKFVSGDQDAPTMEEILEYIEDNMTGG